METKLKNSRLPTRRDCLTIGLAAVGSAAFAQPSMFTKPITLVVPFAAGGPTDLMARIVAEKLGPRLGQPIIIENKAGVGGLLGTSQALKAPADGHTLMLTSTSVIVTSQFTVKNLPFDPRRDLSLLAVLAHTPAIFCVNPSVPADSARAFASYLAANKGRVSYGSSASVPQVYLARLVRSLKAEALHVPYRGEIAIMQDLVGGQLQFAFVSIPNAKSFSAAGRIKMVGVTGERRLPGLPNLPTLLELGFDDELLRNVPWLGMAAPAGTPRPVMDRLAKEIQAVLELPDVRARFVQAFDVEPSFRGPEAFAATYQKDYAMWQRATKELGVTPE